MNNGARRQTNGAGDWVAARAVTHRQAERIEPVSRRPMLALFDGEPVTLAFTVWSAEAFTSTGASSVPMPLAALSVMAAFDPLPVSVPVPARMLPALALRLSVLPLP